MKGKPPKEREQYVIRMDNGTLVEVTRDVYLTWYQSLRRERYQEEQSRKHGVCSLNELEEKGDFFSKPANGGEGAEETALRNIFRDEVHKAVCSLPVEDAKLITLLYFSETSVKDTANILGCCQKTVRNRRKRILKELYQKMLGQEI